ncbi:hypothetical protein Yoon_12740 [Yoonia sp. I 8.24]|nr:hypothetical protein [Yoonia sp. I 8.24]
MDFSLPAQEAAHLEKTYAQAARILEYGSGGSTLVAARLGKQVVAIESDALWAKNMNAILASEGQSEHARVVHEDIGATREWGNPQDSSGYKDFHRYPMGIWDDPDLAAPDVVLIDGRFRVACMCAIIMRCQQPTLVLFDDYGDRLKYHSVERLVQPKEMIGRMAVFEIKPGIDTRAHLTWMIGSFVDYG